MGMEKTDVQKTDKTEENTEKKDKNKVETQKEEEPKKLELTDLLNKSDDYSKLVTLETNLDELDKQKRWIYNEFFPNILYSSGRIIQLLLNSSVKKYIEFKPVTTSYFYGEKGFFKVPSSKSEIFGSKDFTLLQKRHLMKFLKKLQGDEKISDYNALFKQLKLPQEIQDCILQALALADNCTEMKNVEKINTQLKLFMSSLGVFCPEPLIIPMYGAGEIPQGFCRSAAVHGGIYLLRRNIKKIHIKDNAFTGTAETDSGQKITAKYVIGSLDYFNNVEKTEEGVHRCTIISNKKFLDLNDDLDLTIIPANKFNNPNAIRCLTLNGNANVIKRPYCLHHFWTKFSNKEERLSSEKASENLVQGLFTEDLTTEQTKPLLLGKYTFNIYKRKLIQKLPTNVFAVPDIIPSIGYNHIIEETEKIVKQMYFCFF